MTSHDMHAGVFTNNIYKVDKLGDYWHRAVRRSVRAMTKEIQYVRFDLGFQVMDVQGVTCDTIGRVHVAEELQRLLALALAMGKEEFVIRDICPSCPTGEAGAPQVTAAANLITEELQEAFASSGIVPAPTRLSLNNGRFDLRVTLPRRRQREPERKARLS